VKSQQEGKPVAKMLTVQVEEGPLVIPVAVDVWQEWANVHTDADEDGYLIAQFYLYADMDGAVICECCGVNYNPAVDKD
jgi:hypothetical protein